MATRKISGPQEYQITPLAAAYVEALPDRKRAKAIERRFKSHGECPTSAVFDRAAIRKFYGRKIKPVTPKEPTP